MNRPALYSYAVAALVAVCATALAITNHVVPDGLWILGGVSGGAGAMASTPGRVD